MTFYEILDSNFAQTAIVAIGAVLTWIIYTFNKRQEVNNAAKILTLQIKNIEEAISYLKSECISGNSTINETHMHYSKIVFDENQWLKYRHLMVKVLNQNSFEQIDQFYSCATEIKEQQLYIRNKILQLLEYKGMHYYNAIYGQLSEVAIKQVDNFQNDPSNQNTVSDRIVSIRNVYNSPTFNIPTFIPLEFGLGLSKAISRYYPVTNTVAFQKLLKTSNRQF